jgi:ribonuclease III
MTGGCHFLVHDAGFHRNINRSGRQEAMALTIDSLTAKNETGLQVFAERLGYRFKEPRHLQTALIHRSFASEQGKHFAVDNETLEFLGDAVLDLSVSYALFHRFPNLREGDLTRLRAALVNEGHLAVMAQGIGLGEHLLLGRGEEASRGRQKSSILASGYEAVLGAVFLDGGYEPAAAMIERQFDPWLSAEQQSLFIDSKSRLQELLQEKYNEAPVYILENEEGPAHRKLFTVSVRFRDVVLASGSAGSKKEAEQRAAALALEQFKIDDLPRV